MRLWLAWVGALSVPAVAVPHPTDVVAYHSLIAQDLRLATIGYRLAFANRAFCEIKAHSPGWVIHDIAQYSDMEAARTAFSFEKPIAVAAVVPSGPADLAGIVAGDGIVAIDGKILNLSKAEARPTYLRAMAVKALAQRSLSLSGKLPIELLRDQKVVATILRASFICASDFQVDPRSRLDAGANGDVVRVTSAMMDYIADDNELAAVVAHELAHNLLSHRKKLSATKRRKTSAILATEIEADRLAVWLMANAGYEPTAALRFWERYGKEHGLGIFTDRTHLRWEKRVEIMQAEIESMATTGKKDGKLPPPLLTIK